MATTLQNSLMPYYFSSQLPDLTWQTDAESLTVVVESVGYPTAYSNHIIEATLVPVDGVVKLWEVREEVERKMRQWNRSHLILVIKWREPENQFFYNSSTMRVFYCSLNLTQYCSDWLRRNFLTTLQSKPLPAPAATESMSFVTVEQSAVTPELMATCRLSSGEVRVLQIDDFFDPLAVDITNVRSLDWTLDDVLAAAVDAEATVVEVIGVTIRMGMRVMNYYKPALPANEAFVFNNAFGVLETAWLNCVTTTKTKDARKVASIARRAVLYDLDQSVTHEVETSPVPLEVAYWLAQLVTSPRAWLGNGKPIVITDGDSSISDDAAVLNSVKFTWQFDDARNMMDRAENEVNIFIRPPYAHQFD